MHPSRDVSTEAGQLQFLVEVTHYDVLTRYKRQLLRLTLGHEAAALHLFLEVPDRAAIPRFTALFASRPGGQSRTTETNLPMDGAVRLKNLLPRTWATMEGELPSEEDASQVPLPSKEFLVALDRLALLRQRGGMTNEEFRAAKEELIARRQQARIRANSLLLR